MKNRSLFAGVIAIAAASVLLAGCAAPVAAPTGSPISSPTSAPAPKAASAPGSRVPFRCADLYTSAAVQPLVGAPVTVIHDESTPPTSFEDLANAQLGTLSCEWGGGQQFEAGWTADVDVVIAPDSAAAFTEQYSRILSGIPETYGPPVLNTAGDKSEYECTPTGREDNAPLCYSQMLIGTYWVSVEVEALAPATAVTTGTTTAEVLKLVAAKLKTAGSPKTLAWPAPGKSEPTFCSSADSTATVRSIVGAPDLAVFPTDAFSPDAARAALAGRYVSCSWTSPTVGGVNVELVAGGSWAFPGFTPVFGDSIVQSASPVNVAGTSGAQLGCASGACQAYFAVGTTAASISMNDFGSSAKNIAVLIAFAKAIAAS